MGKLYNGIELPEYWPPKNIDMTSDEPMRIPYLENKPDVIDISVGRQLFVDDFLTEETDLTTVYHRPVKYEGNPIFTPQTPAEAAETLACACPKSGGVWFDKLDGKFKMWYEAGWLNKLAYAESTDGIRWERPVLDVVPGTNLILPGVMCDSCAVFIDYDTKLPDERYKMFMRGPGGTLPGAVFTSPDGIHWIERQQTESIGDRSTIFYNSFTKKWVYSIRDLTRLTADNKKTVTRVRYYRECDDFVKGARWSPNEIVFWLRADKNDLPDPEIGETSQLYNFDAVAYESIMIGMFEVHRGPKNAVCEAEAIPKITELVAAYSRDGFHFSRPDREPFIPAARTAGSWDRGYVQPVGGVCLIMGDELWFYYSGFEGDQSKKEPSAFKNGMYDRGSTGIAKLRRDGFASLEGDGSLLTRKLTAENKRHLFVNVRAPEDELRAEILDDHGMVIEPFSMERCIPVSGDHTCAMVSWEGGADLSALSSGVFRIRFRLSGGALYSFWLSGDQSGGSAGYDAAGAPKG